MSGEPSSALGPPTGGNGSLVPSGSPLVARALADLTPARPRVAVLWGWGGGDALLTEELDRLGCVTVPVPHAGRASDLLAHLPFDVLVLAGRSVDFLAEVRFLLPDEIPIVYTSAWDSREETLQHDYARASEAGAAFIHPLSWSGGIPSLRDALALSRFLRDHTGSRGWPAPPPPDPAAFRILVVEDELTVRSLLEWQIEKLGFRVSSASDGLDGLSKLEADAPDVLWTDECMPGLSGGELLDRVASHTDGRIPCIHEGRLGELSVWRRIRPSFRYLHLPSERAWIGTYLKDAIRLRRAFQYALSPQVLCGTRGLAPPPLPPPVGPHRPGSTS